MPITLRFACAGLCLLFGSQQPATAVQSPQPPATPNQDPTQERNMRLSTRSWCADTTTLCFGSEARVRGGKALTGVRFSFEPQLGVLFQNGDNKFVDTNFKELEKVGLETNLYKGYVGLQLLLIYPSSIEFDDQSPLVTDSLLVNGGTKADVEWGLSAGLTFLDGIIAFGFGALRFDERDFTATARMDSELLRDSYWYFNIQPVAAVKTAIKNVQ